MRALLRALVVSLVTSLVLYTPLPARANGRFPKAQAIATIPGGDGSTLYMRATFGVLVSRDAGKTFQWLCEQALGFSSTWDPPIAVTRDGRLWIALANGLRATRDGCEITEIPALKGELVADLTVDGPGERVYLVTSSPDRAAYVWRSKGETFERLGSGLKGFRFDTIEVAPSKPSRIYLTGVPEGNGTRAHFFRSDDGGVTLRETKPVLPNDGRLFVSAVDPKDESRVLARLLSDKGSDVLLSTDGGTTFKRTLHMAGAMFGFTRSDDGATYYAGSGDPAEGIHRSTDRGETWTPVAKASVHCLHASGDRLYSCSNPYTPGGYAMGLSLDRGMTVKPLATFDDVTGPQLCDSGASSKCVAPWPETRAMIATSAQMPSPTIDALPALPDAASLDAGVAPAPPPRRSSCACRAIPSNDGSRGPLALLVVLVGAFVVRLRAGSRSPQRSIHSDPGPSSIHHRGRGPRTR